MSRSILLAGLLGLFSTLAAADPLVVYCGRKEALVGPILAQFEQDTGVTLDVRYNKTQPLATQLAAEGKETPADLFYAQESGYLGALGKSGILAPLPDALLKQVDQRFVDPDGRWLGVTGRLRVLVYDTKQVTAEQLPKSLKDLADPKWKGKIGWAPGNASFQAHVSVLRHSWGEDETKAWLTAVRDNGAKVYPKNSPQVKAAHAGEIALGWVNHYYLHKLKEPGFQAANVSFPETGKFGNVLMVSGVGVVATSKRQELALKLAEYLVTEPAQTQFAQKGYEYPVRPGVTPHPDVQPLDQIELAEIDQRHLTDIGPTLKMLRDLGLQ